MMAAFIIAIQGTIAQAVLLGLSATLSHTAVVWAVALAGQYFGRQWGGETSEPYFQLASAVIIICIAVWMIWRTWREQNAESHEHHHPHGHEDIKNVSTSWGVLHVAMFEDGVPPRWRVTPSGATAIAASDIEVETVRTHGARQSFAFTANAIAQAIQPKAAPNTTLVFIIDQLWLPRMAIQFARPVVTYAVGATATFWFLERMAVFGL